ncbi:MAG: hypothetical protein M1338_00860 [Patescibacteria group bacterium]|nr:hypothetical protein [Patescibacteria group bacterium]
MKTRLMKLIASTITAITMILALLALGTLTGCSIIGPVAVGPRVYGASVKSTVLEEKLHQDYLVQSRQIIKSGSNLTQPKEPSVEPVGNPVVIFKNNDHSTLLVKVADTRGVSPQVWTFRIEPGQIKVFPKDDPQAPVFRYQNWYRITWSREHDSHRYYDRFLVTVEPHGWDSESGTQFHGGYQFLPSGR